MKSNVSNSNFKIIQKATKKRNNAYKTMKKDRSIENIRNLKKTTKKWIQELLRKLTFKIGMIALIYNQNIRSNKIHE